MSSNLDYILNGCASGDVADRLMACNWDVNCLRPFVGNNGKIYITINDNGKLRAIPVTNTAATLRLDEWKTLDAAIIKASRQRLKAVADVRAAGLTYTIPNGFGKTVFQTEKMSDIEGAQLSMDGLRESKNERPLFDVTNLPLPIIHKDFSFSARQIAESRNGGSPLDTNMAEQAGRKVAEEAEKMLLGVSDFNLYKYGGGTIYGLTNFDQRNQVTITAPTASGWTPRTTLLDVLNLRQTAQDDLFYGPYMLYCSSAWDEYLDDDFNANYPNVTLRNRLAQIDNISGVRTLDYLTGYTMLLVQMTSDVVREVIGMELTTVQWESNGGLLKHFKVMMIMVPQVRADYNDHCGLVHGATA